MVDQTTATRETAASPSLGRIVGFFARYGNFRLGGGSATSAVMHHERREKESRTVTLRERDGAQINPVYRVLEFQDFRISRKV
jgi:hypothetical protein